MNAGDVDLRDEVGRAFVYEAGMAALGFAASIAFARILGPQVFGAYSLLYAVTRITDRLVAGVGEAAKKRISSGAIDAAEAIGTTAIAAISIAVLAGVLGIFADPLIADYTGIEHAGLLYALLVATIGGFESLQVILTASGRVGLENLIDFVQTVTTIPLQFLGILLIGGAEGMAIGLAVATATTIPLTMKYVSSPALPSWQTVASLWEYARFAAIERVVVRLWTRIDLLMVGALSTAAVAGHLEVAEKLSGPALFVVGPTAAGVLAQVSDREENGGDVGAAIGDALAHASILALPILALALAIPHHLVLSTYGKEYAAAAPFLASVATYRLLVSQSRPIAAALKGLDRPDITAKLSVVGLIVNVILGVLLFYLMGAVGVIVSAVLAQAVWLSIAAHMLQRHVTVSIPASLWIELAAGALMFVVADVLARAVAGETWISLMTVILPSFGLYLLVLVVIPSTRRVLVDLTPGLPLSENPTPGEQLHGQTGGIGTTLAHLGRQMDRRWRRARDVLLGPRLGATIDLFASDYLVHAGADTSDRLLGLGSGRGRGQAALHAAPHVLDGEFVGAAVDSTGTNRDPSHGTGGGASPIVRTDVSLQQVPGQEFDHVLAHDVFSRLPPAAARECLQHLPRLLDDDGVVHVLVASNRGSVTVDNVTDYAPETLETWARDAGFDVERVEEPDLDGYILLRLSVGDGSTTEAIGS